MGSRILRGSSVDSRSLSETSTRQSAVDVLAKVPLFAAVPRQDLGELATHLKRKRLLEGETLFLEGSPGSYLYIIVEGSIRIIARSIDGREVQMALLGPFDVIGELSALDGKPRSGEARAAEDTQLYALSGQALKNFVLSHPAVAWELLKVLASRLRKADEALADAAFLDVPGRVAKKLLELAETTSKKTPEGYPVTRPVTQEQLAAMVGATREGVNRALSAFAAMGAIERRGRSYVLKDREVLRRRATM
jgi:CRP/FNR family cyclic AMP-dependent transcriptional regulator